MKISDSLAVLLLSLLASGPGQFLAAQTIQGTPPAQAPTESSRTTAQSAPDYSQEPFVIESFITRARYEIDGTGRVENSSRLRVQSEAGVQALGQLMFPYNASNERLEIDYVRVRKADGTVVTSGPSDVQDLSSQIVRDAPMYTDAREKHVTVPALRPGETLEYQVSTVIFAPLAPNQFWFQCDFEKNAITLDQQLELDVPATRELKLKTAPGFEPNISETGGRRVYRWTSSYRRREDQETAGKKQRSKQPGDFDVRVTTFASWQQIAAWYQNLERDRIVVTPDIRKKAGELVSGLSSPMEKLEALYDYVARNFRYVSISLGSGRFQPHAATEVLANQYGDCKDKHTLLAALAAAEGLRADAVLIHSQRKLDPDLPTPASFDHVITRVAVGDDFVWLDTTPEVAPFRLLSAPLRHKQALAIPPDGAAEIVETPADPPFPARQMLSVEGTISDLGKLDARVRYLLRGDTELLLRLAFRRTPQTQWKQLGQIIANGDGLRGDVDDVKPSDPSATRQPFTLELHLIQAGYFDWTSKRVQMALPVPHLALPEANQDAGEQTEPLELGSPAEVTLEMKLTVPARYAARSPVAVNVTRDYAEYRSVYSAQQNVLAASRSLRVLLRQLPPERERDFALFFRRAVTNDEAQTFYLEASVAGAPAIPENASAEDLFQAAAGASANRQYALAEQLFERVVALEPKHQRAWKMLGVVRLPQQKNQAAIEAFRKQAELYPYDEFAYEGMGLAQLAQQNYDDAIASFRKQLEVKPLDPIAQTSLGSALREARRYAEAVPELEKAISLSPESPQLYVNLGQAQLNLNWPEKAQAAFDKALELDASPPVWNNVAYELSLHGVNLDRAQQYAESAVAADAAELRNIVLERLKPREFFLVTSLANYWDTLGWVYFQRGDLVRAERFVEAAWRLDFHGEVGDHLGQIYEKLGRIQEAKLTYAMALAATRSVPETRARLEKLAGGPAQASVLANRAGDQLSRLREYDVGRLLPPKVSGMAEFFVLLGPGPGVEAVKFIGGSDSLRGAGEKLRALDYGRVFPDDAPTKLVRRGVVSCAEGDQNCLFTLVPVGLVTSVN
jgi:tetratricopeptide (TPR) repeat protein/transglutaminase-like putative cysteine protease